MQETPVPEEVVEAEVSSQLNEVNGSQSTEEAVLVVDGDENEDSPVDAAVDTVADGEELDDVEAEVTPISNEQLLSNVDAGLYVADRGRTDSGFRADAQSGKACARDWCTDQTGRQTTGVR